MSDFECLMMRNVTVNVVEGGEIIEVNSEFFTGQEVLKFVGSL